MNKPATIAKASLSILSVLSIVLAGVGSRVWEGLGVPPTGPGPEAVNVDDAGDVSNVSETAGESPCAHPPATGNAAATFGRDCFEPMRAAAADLHQGGDVEGAVRVLTAIVEAAPPGFDRASANRQLGTYAYMRGDRGRALALLLAAVEDYATLPMGESLAVDSLMMLADLHLHDEPERALAFYRRAAAGAEASGGARDRQFAAATGGIATTLGLLGRDEEEAAAIATLLERFPSYGADQGGRRRAGRRMRLAELEHPPGLERRAAIRRLADEPWLGDAARIDALEGVARECLAWPDQVAAVAVAVEALPLIGPSTFESKALSRSSRNLLFVIVDHPQHVDAATVRRATGLLADHADSEALRARMRQRLQEPERP